MGRELRRVPLDFVCKGHAIHPDDFEASEAWEGTEPPEGEGYQLWETTSEGSPISPVFATIEELCEHAAQHCTTFGPSKTSAINWRRMLDENFVYTDGGQTPDGSRMIFL